MEASDTIDGDGACAVHEPETGRAIKAERGARRRVRETGKRKGRIGEVGATDFPRTPGWRADGVAPRQDESDRQRGTNASLPPVPLFLRTAITAPRFPHVPRSARPWPPAPRPSPPRECCEPQAAHGRGRVDSGSP